MGTVGVLARQAQTKRLQQYQMLPPPLAGGLEMAPQPQTLLAVVELAEPWGTQVLANGSAGLVVSQTTQLKETDQTDSRHLILLELVAAAQTHRPPHLQEERAVMADYMAQEVVVVLDA